MTQQCRLDLAKLHAIAASLHHTITTPDISIADLRLLVHDIAGSIPAFALLVDEERTCVLLRQVPVAAHYVRPRHQQLSRLSAGDAIATLIHHPAAIRRTNLADGKCR